MSELDSRTSVADASVGVIMVTIARRVTLSIFLVVITASTPAGPVRNANDLARDRTQTMKARGVLLQDPELAAFNIGVIVQDRVAILWGPVPSAEVAFRAELCLRGMAELREVRNELMVHEAIQPIRLPKKLEPSPKTRQILPELLPPELPQDVHATPGAPGVLTGSSSVTTKTRQSAGQILATEIRILLLSKNTYQSVRFTLEGKRVYLRSTLPEQSDVLQEVARAIARFPNVESVIVLDQASKISPD
jgi:hypothetical protein